LFYRLLLLEQNKKKVGGSVEDLCNERHKVIDERLKDHGKQLDELTKSDAVNTTMITQICKKLDGLTTAIWALVLTFAGGLIGFFFYAIQTKIFN
jgi:hypothetical protein